MIGNCTQNCHLGRSMVNQSFTFPNDNFEYSYPQGCLPGPGCSKLMTSLVNETLKFQTLISQICQYFLLKNVKFLQCKSVSHFFNKNINVLDYKVVKYLTS